MKNTKTMKNKFKAFASIMLLLTMGIGQMWGAADYTFAAGTFAGDKLSATVDGQTFTFSLEHGGAGSNSYAGGSGGNYVKISAGKTVTITFPYGFVASKLNIKGYTNKDTGTLSEISEVAGSSQSEKTFPLRNTNDISEYDFAISSEATSITFKTKKSTEQACLLITITGTAPSCTAPTIAWNVEPAGGEVGDDDFVASVTTTPADHAVTWTSSNTSVATVSNGTVHYVAPGTTTITASLTYTGDDYCKTTVSVNKNILVPIPTSELGTNDMRWYFKNAVPGSSPVDGLTFNQGTTSGNGVYGVKLNSSGYAWFAKPAVSGTLRIGAYYKDASMSAYAYEVNVYACSSAGEKGDLINVLSIASAGNVSDELAIDASVEGIYIVRKTSNEGALYFIEFIADAETPACPSGLSISGTTAYTEGQTIELEAALAAGNGTITYTWYKGANLSVAKSAGSIGTGASFSKASCSTGDAGNYWCEATKDDCSAASNASAYTVTVAEDVCPKSGVVYSLVVKSAEYSVPKQTETNMVSDYATVTGGETYIGNSHTTDAGKAQVMTTGGGTVYFGGNNGYIKVVLDCDMQANDVISFDNGSGSNQISFTTAATRATTPATSSNTWTVTSEFATAVNSNSNTFYIWRASSSSTYLHSLTITRPYDVSFASAHGTAPTTPTKAITLTLEKIADVEGWKHIGWTANTTVKVGGEDKTAGTALAVDATVTVSANTVFTAVWKDASALSENAYLSSLSVAGYALDFNKETTSYNIVLDYGTSTLPEITYEVEDTGLATAEKVEGGVNGATTITVTPEAGAGHEKVYTINFSVNTSPKFVIYDGSTMTDIASSTFNDESTGFSYSMASSIPLSGSNVAGSWSGKDYTKAIKGFKPTDNANNIVSFVIPNGYLATVRLVGSTNSDGNERKMFVALNASKNPDDALDNYILTSSTFDAVGLVTNLLPPGTYYLGATEGYRLFEFSAQLYQIDYSRELAQGTLSTTCLPNGGVVVGASIYEIAYMDYEADGSTPNKIYFDEVVDGVMEAGMPYVVLVDENSTGMSVLYTDSENKAAQSKNGLVGYMGATKALEANDYFIYNNLFYYVSAEDAESGRIKISNNRAYLNLADIPGYTSYVPAPGRRRVSMGNGDAPKIPTAVDNAQADNVQSTKVLIDGQFFILRGEKMYDATGRLVK